jgi:hypothetical protein
MFGCLIISISLSGLPSPTCHAGCSRLAERVRKLVRRTTSADRPPVPRTIQGGIGRRRKLLLDAQPLCPFESGARYTATGGPLDPMGLVCNRRCFFNTSPASYQSKRSTADGRDWQAYLAHRRTTPMLRELAIAFGLTHPDSVSNLIRRAEIAVSASKSQRQALARIEELLRKQ